MDPTTDRDLESHLRFEYDARAKVTSVWGVSERGKTTEELLGLNRYELRSYRTRQIRMLDALRRLAQEDPEARELWAESVAKAEQGESEYSAFVRALDLE